MLKLNNWLNPMTDSCRSWSSVGAGKEFMQKKFGVYAPNSRVDWNGHDPHSDEALEWWATSGYGAIELKQLTGKTAEKEGIGQRSACFVSSYEFLNDLAVRPGLATYGGAAYLDKDGKILKIKLRGEDIFPGETQSWKQAKFAYRSSSFMWVTLYHHLIYTHLLVANKGVLSTIRTLPVAHPLRRLMKPFVFGATATNNGALEFLLPKGSIFHRAIGFTAASLEEAFSMMQKKLSFQSFHQSINQQGLDQHSLAAYHADICPYARDGELYWNTLNTFSEDILTNSPAFKNIVRDDKTKAWWGQVNLGFNYGGLDLSVEALIPFLTQFFFTVTAFHSWVGHVSPYVLDPSVAAGKLFPEATQADQQNSLEMGVIASMTGHSTPELMGDFSHLMPDKRSNKSLKRLQVELGNVSQEIKKRNSHRAIPLPAFDPAQMKLSAAI